VRITFIGAGTAALLTIGYTVLRAVGWVGS